MLLTMATVYDEDGRGYIVDTVDAREYLATGRFFNEPPEPAKPKQAPKAKPKLKTVSNDAGR
jgi:hypothetical protein